MDPDIILKQQKELNDLKRVIHSYCLQNEIR